MKDLSKPLMDDKVEDIEIMTAEVPNQTPADIQLTWNEFEYK